MTNRKRNHLDVCLHRSIEAGNPGFDFFRLPHRALPDINFDEVDTSTHFLNQQINAPVIISAITGGIPEAKKINQNLARAASRIGLPLGLGSIRPALENPRQFASFQVRPLAPKVPILANLGAVQLNHGVSISQIISSVKKIQADGLFLHLNPLQEAIQPQGNTNFAGLDQKIRALVKQSPFPILVKEVGSGLAAADLKKLKSAGVKIFDLAGSGGTNWALIEGRNHPLKIGPAFAEWGWPTAEAVISAAKIPGIKLIAGGGVRTGVDAAKAIALGADYVAIGLPLLAPAARSTQACQDQLKKLIEELKIAMFCSGAKNLAQLKEFNLTKFCPICQPSSARPKVS